MGKIYLIHFNDGMMQTAVNVEHGVFQAANEGELDISPDTIHCERFIERFKPSTSFFEIAYRALQRP